MVKWMFPPTQPTPPPEQQEPLYAAIAGELITLTPETWNALVLNVSVEISPVGVLGMSHAIVSPEGHREPVIVSEQLSDLTHKLLMVFRQHGQEWTGFRFEVRQLPDGDWRYACDFSYR